MVLIYIRLHGCKYINQAGTTMSGYIFFYLTAREGLREDLGGEGCPGTDAGLVLTQVLSAHVPPAVVQKPVEDIGSDDFSPI